MLPTDTPDELGFRVMWYNPVPPIEKASYRLEIGGMVENPLQLTIEQLRSYPKVEQSTRLKCVQCWSARTTWGGSALTTCSTRVKPLAGATSVRIDAADKWYEYMSLEEMVEPGVMMCLEMAGKPLTGPAWCTAPSAGTLEVRIQVREAHHQDHLR